MQKFRLILSSVNLEKPDKKFSYNLLIIYFLIKNIILFYKKIKKLPDDVIKIHNSSLGRVDH
jgi:hypothetical protein